MEHAQSVSGRPAVGGWIHGHLGLQERALPSTFNPLVAEQRSGPSMFYFSTGDNKLLAVDKIMLHGAHALEAQGFILKDGEEVTEKSRSIKNIYEINAMRCANHTCETAVTALEDFARSNVQNGQTSENDI